MRSSIFFFAGVLAAGALSYADDMIIPQPECTYSRAAEAAKSAPALWHRISANAEIAAPTSADSGRHPAANPPANPPPPPPPATRETAARTRATAGRHRAANPPANPPQTFTAVNFVDTEVCGGLAGGF